MTSSKISYSRVNRPQAEAANYYNRLSRFYDLLAASEKKFIKQGIDLINPGRGEKILEIGSGTGFAQLILTRVVGGVFSAGLDISEGMCRVASKKIRGAGFGTRTHILCSNSLPVPFKNSVFDAVFTSFTLELFDSPQIPEVLQEIQRVLKPGGRMVVVCLSKDQALPWPGRLYERLHDRYPKLLDCRPIPIRSLAAEAGFTILEYQETSMWGLPVTIVLTN